jgi:hypothetical protein
LLLLLLRLFRCRVSKEPRGLWNCVVTATDTVSGKWQQIRQEFPSRNVSKIEFWVVRSWGSKVAATGSPTWQNSVLGSNCAEHRTYDFEMFFFNWLALLAWHACRNSFVFLYFTWEISVRIRKRCIVLLHSTKLDKMSIPNKIILFESICLCWLLNYKQNLQSDTRWRSWLRHCATSRKVADSILEGVIGIFFTFICLRATSLSYDVAHRTVRSWRQNAFGCFSRWPWNTLGNRMCCVACCRKEWGEARWW